MPDALSSDSKYVGFVVGAVTSVEELPAAAESGAAAEVASAAAPAPPAPGTASAAAIAGLAASAPAASAPEGALVLPLRSASRSSTPLMR